MSNPAAPTLTHFAACLVIRDAMTAVQCEAANAEATHNHGLCRSRTPSPTGTTATTKEQ